MTSRADLPPPRPAMPGEVPTLVLPPRYTPDSMALWKAAGRLGWHTERLATWRAPFDLSDAAAVVCYGGLSFLIADDLRVALLVPPLDWLTTLPGEYLRRRVAFTTLADARRLGRRAFVKPADEKAFVAGVYEPGRLVASDLLPPDMPVLVSDPVDWTVEFRCFVRDGRVWTLSPYLREGQRVETEAGEWPATDAEFAEAEAFAGAMLSDPRVRVPPAVVVDVGLIRGAGWAVVEANPAWASGIYGCDPARVLHVIRRACVRHDRLTDEDRHWLRAGGCP